LEPRKPIQEEFLDFNPVDVQKHLEGMDYPASGEEFSGPDQVMAALKRS
jgi:hypothetical protein